LKWNGIGPPVRDASKVLECGFSYFIVWKWGKRTRRWNAFGAI
jgi:hypothetical protein